MRAADMTRRRIIVVFGTRPEAIKLAPVILGLRESPVWDPTVVVTAQHREMLDSVLETFEIAPQFDLDIIQDRQSLSDITVRALERLAPLLEAQRPDAVLVQGDTTTTFAGALAAFYQRIPVVHLEAGLRTSDPAAPFPEEINRRLTTQVAALHLTPTWSSRANLLRENIRPDQVLVTGNTVIDAMLWALAREPRESSELLDRLNHEPRRLLLVTAHRRESWGPPLEAIARALARLARSEPDLIVVLPMHRNPVVREALAPALQSLDNVITTEPLPYDTFVRLMARADVVLTDSGGIQEEAPSLGKPVLVMRDTTERPEAVDAGTASMVGTDEEAIVAAVQRLLHDDATYERMAKAVNPYGDGHAAERTVAALTHLAGCGPRPEDFRPA
jgi:UDP-N-acetylglucosamine 2-epimerase (non-hydrolysing)